MARRQASLEWRTWGWREMGRGQNCSPDERENARQEAFLNLVETFGPNKCGVHQDIQKGLSDAALQGRQAGNG
jgi:hypothetical protein